MDKDCRTPKAHLSSLKVISPSILAELASLNLTGRLSKTRKVISGGAYGDISKGHFRAPDRRVKVAVKCLRFYLKEDIKTSHQLFEKEIYVWSKLDHENILPLMGYSIDIMTGFPLLVSRWMENGSAWTYVNSHPNPDVLRLVTGIASGLAYLHRNRVVHSDIKSDNVLVSASGNALICDFGCSRMVAASRSLANLSSGIRGTSRYLAYELVAPVPSCHTQKTDVWAFGMTVYELAFRQRPFAGLTDFQVVSAIMHYDLPRLPTLDPFDHHFERKEIFKAICVDCWKLDPVDRPDMSAISNKLKEEQKAPQLWTLPISESGPGPILMRNTALPSFLFNSRFYDGKCKAERIEHNKYNHELSGPVSFEVSERAHDTDDFFMQAHVSDSKRMLKTLGGRKPKRTKNTRHGLGCFIGIQQKKCDENIDPDCSCTPCTQLRCQRLGTNCPDWMQEWDEEKIKAFLAKNEKVKSSSTFTDNELCNPISFSVPVYHNTSGINEDSVHGDGMMNRCTNSVDIGCGGSRNLFGMDLLNYRFAGNISPGI
ncbi:hypothetical protein ACEPAH_7365 [Sanghuangporus vaninii]